MPRPRKESYDDATWQREVNRASDRKITSSRAVPSSFSVQRGCKPQGENDQDEAVASCGLFAVPADADSSESLSGAPLLSLSADAEWGWQT